jgi:magnesium and cobalt transporter
VTLLIQAALPALAGMLMIWAGMAALAGEGSGELGADALAGAGETGLGADRVIHVIHVASLTIAAALAGAVTQWWNHPPMAATLRVLLVTVLVWSLGDLIPRLLATLAPDMVPRVRTVVLTARSAYLPLLALAARLDRQQGGAVQGVERVGAVSPREMARGVFSLKSMTVSEVMTPRIDIISVDIGDEEEDVINTLRRSEHARLLVIDSDPDSVVGVIYAKDVLPRLASSAPRGKWQELVRPAAFVPEAKTLERQLRDFQRGPAHLAVVVDEFGGTAGLVTLEDILEQIVGEIQDEHDVDEAQPILLQSDGRWVVQGGVALVDLEQEIGHDFGREDVATVGGLVLAEIGRVPRSGDRLELDGWEIVADLVARRRVRRVTITAPQRTEQHQAEVPG